MARRVFHSFHYNEDAARAQQIRNMGVVEGNKPATPNEWEKVASGPNKDAKIQNWIDNQLAGRSCTIVLAGTNTADRPWINYEIEESWNKGMGVCVIHVHKLEPLKLKRTPKGSNPMSYVSAALSKKGSYEPVYSKTSLSLIAPTYDSSFVMSNDVYKDISDNMEWVIEEAIRIRGIYS